MLFRKKEKEQEIENKPEPDTDDNVIVVKRTMDKKGKMIFVLAVVIIFAAVGFAIFRYNMVRTYQGYNVISTYETSGDNVADYTVFAGNVLKVTKDGASYIDENGVMKWNVSYAMKMPQAEVCGDYAIVADMNGKDVYIFDTEGEVSRQTMNYDVANIAIAQQGVYCLVLTGEDCSYIHSYDKNSTFIYKLQASIDDIGYPMDIDISNDGQKLVVSYLNVSGTQICTTIAMYNFGSVGQNENADRLMGSFEIEDSIYPSVSFTDNDTIACFGDNDIRIYDMDEKPSEKTVISLDGREMQGVFASSGCIGYISLAQDGASAKYSLYIYDTDGNMKAVSEYDNSYETIYATEDEIIVVGDTDCSIFRFNGSIKFDASFAKDLVNIVPDSNKNEYFVIFENETQTIALSNN